MSGISDATVVRPVELAQYQRDSRSLQDEVDRLIDESRQLEEELGKVQVEKAKAAVRCLAGMIHYWHPEAVRIRLEMDEFEPWWNMRVFDGRGKEIQLGQDCEDDYDWLRGLCRFEVISENRNVLSQLPRLSGGPFANRIHVDFDPQHI